MFCNYTYRYFITKTGQVYDSKLERFIPQQVTPDGYYKVTLRDCYGKRKTFSVHRLVCWKYRLNPENKETVNHIDGDKSNNHSWNLEWATRSEQTQHAWDLGLIRNLEARSEALRRANSKSVKCVTTGEVFKSLTDAASAYNIKKSNISAVCLGKVGCKSAGKLPDGTKLIWRYENDD